MRISDWSSDVCSSDLDKMDRRKVIIGAACGAATAGMLFVLWAPASIVGLLALIFLFGLFTLPIYSITVAHMNDYIEPGGYVEAASGLLLVYAMGAVVGPLVSSIFMQYSGPDALFAVTASVHLALAGRSEEHTSELQSLMRISYAVFCLKKKKTQ